jgi:HEAT repeat protein
VEIAKLFKLIFPVLIKNQNYTEAKDILTCLKWDYQNQPSFPKDKEKEILSIIKETGGYAIADQLTMHLLASSFSRETKIIEDILFLLGTEGVCQKLVEIFTIDDRLVRMNALRMLIKIGEPALPALAKLLTERRNLVRKPNSALLTNESWYKVRNALFVLANLVDISSVNLITKLKDDPDPRVRQEVIKALEKQKPDLVIGYLLHYLEDQDSGIRKTAIETLGVLQNPLAVDPLINNFSRRKEDRPEVIKSLTKINGEKAWQFMTDIITGREKENWGISGKISDEVKISALNGLAKKITPQVIKHLERFLEVRKKGLKSILGMDRLDAEIQKFLTRHRSSAPLSA